MLSARVQGLLYSLTPHPHVRGPDEKSRHRLKLNNKIFLKILTGSQLNCFGKKFNGDFVQRLFGIIGRKR